MLLHLMFSAGPQAVCVRDSVGPERAAVILLYPKCGSNGNVAAFQSQRRCYEPKSLSTPQ